MKTVKLLALLIGIIGISNSVYAISPGAKAPNLYGRNLDQSLFRLSGIRQNLVLINFFWVQCIPCKKELPELAELEHDNPGVKFLVVHVEDEELPAIQRFLQALPGYPRHVVMSSPMVKKSFAIKGLPYTVLIRDGIIDSEYLGYTEKGFRRLKARLRALRR